MRLHHGPSFRTLTSFDVTNIGVKAYKAATPINSKRGGGSTGETPPNMIGNNLIDA